MRTRVRPGPWTEEMRYGIRTQRTAKGLEAANQEKTGVRFSKEEGGNEENERAVQRMKI